MGDDLLPFDNEMFCEAVPVNKYFYDLLPQVEQ